MVLDHFQIHHLAHRIIPGRQRLFIKIFEKPTTQPHGYFFIDGRQTTPAKARFKTDIFNGYFQRVFVPE